MVLLDRKCTQSFLKHKSGTLKICYFILLEIVSMPTEDDNEDSPLILAIKHFTSFVNPMNLSEENSTNLDVVTNLIQFGQSIYYQCIVNFTFQQTMNFLKQHADQQLAVCYILKQQQLAQCHNSLPCGIHQLFLLSSTIQATRILHTSIHIIEHNASKKDIAYIDTLHPHLGEN